MSEFSCPVIELTAFRKHPNADTLSITEVDGCPVVFRTEEFKSGDLLVYIPVEAIVPVDDFRFSFLGTKEGQTT